MYCATYPGRAAVGTCVRCGRAVCSDCAVDVQGRLTCRSCVSAGTRYPSATSAKSPGIAAVLSFLWSGLGQIYNGQIGKGIFLVVVQIINFILMFVLIGFVTGFLVWVYGIYDAYKTAEQINAELGTRSSF